MKISNINLYNFRAAKSLNIELNEHMNLFVGVNGAGKSTVLQAITYVLLSFVRKMHNSKSSNSFIKSSDIYQSEDQSSIEVNLNYNKESYTWSIERTKAGGSSSLLEVQEELNILVKTLKKKYKNNESLPVLVYYPVGRVVEKNVPISYYGVSPAFPTKPTLRNLTL